MQHEIEDSDISDSWKSLQQNYIFISHVIQ